jgi:predicted nucleic acid-binding protein
VTQVLIDTSVWRRYFAGRTEARATRTLDTLLEEEGGILTHPAVLGELVLGGLSAREERLFARLPSAYEVSNAEVLDFVKHRKLQRRGVGWIDSHLLASAVVTQARLWSLDRKLSEVAEELEIAYTPGAHSR